jgi:alpha-tubulin suppressor-like RCC1 family protein
MAKGALKIMTWTKAKMAVLSGAIIALAAISTIIVAEHRQKAPPFQPGRLKLPTGSVTPMVECGGGHNVLILASSGSLWTWGEEELGWPVLGLADTNIEKTTHMLRIGHDSDWTSIAAGVSDCLAIKSDGSLWGWGANFCYQLGDGTQETRVTPVPSVPGHDWKQAAAGNNVSLAIKNDGTLWSWGESSAGNLGIGALDESTNAIQVGASTNWTKVWAGDLQTIGLQADGSLWFWGSFTGDTKDKQTYRVPVRISPETNWVDACLGYYTAFAIKSDGTLWSWGREARDYTGETDPGSIFTPKQVGSESDWQSCASMAGMFYHILKKKDGSLWAMDASEYRMIKPATQYQPVKLWKIKLKKDVDVAAYAAGIDSHGVVLTRDGEVWTWGPVMGEHGAKDYGPHGGMKYSNSKKIRFFDEPWQVSNVE